MISTKLLSELNTILTEDYAQSLSPKELSGFADELMRCYETLVEITQETNNAEQ
jgi:hypothetical protein